MSGTDAPRPERLVFFDLDGTITRGGTLGPYVVWLLRRRPWQLLRLALVIPAVAAFLLGRIDRGELKARLLSATLRGRTRAELERWTARFVPRVLARRARADALLAIESHRDRGDRLVLLSASPDLYVPRIAAQLGFDAAISTGILWNGDRLDGRLVTPNRRGLEKTRSLKELAIRHPGCRTAAYANASSDLDHLSQVDEPLLVCGSFAARRRAARAGIPSARWR
jgi:phosphatidylglycerophosphatase C